MDIALLVNGRPTRRSIPESRLLCDLLRDDLGLHGTKVGCREGVCGSCTVLLDGRPVRSCLVLAVQAQGADVQTVEGLAEAGALHPVQRALVEHGGLQCGFCTPGMIMTIVALLADNPEPTRAEIVEGLAGNLCRCTGYVKIVEAVIDVVSRPAPGTTDDGIRPSSRQRLR